MHTTRTTTPDTPAEDTAPPLASTPPWLRRVDAVILTPVPNGHGEPRWTWAYVTADGDTLATGGTYPDRWDAIEAASRVVGTWVAGLASTITTGAFVPRGHARSTSRDTHAVTMVDPAVRRGGYRKAPTR